MTPGGPPFKTAMKWLLGVLFVLVGIAHFTSSEFFVRIVPPYLPWPRELVLISGAFEVLGGVGLLFPWLTVPAAWGLIALLIAVFPANVHMALNPDEYPRFSRAVLWGRLPLQGVFIAWVYWFTRK